MSLKDTSVSAWEALSVTLASGSSLSGTINLGGLRLFGLTIPAAWTAAALSFQVSPDAGANWYELMGPDGAAVTLAPQTSCCMMLDPKFFAPFQYIRLRSGLAAAPVAQGADRMLNLFLRSI